MQAEAPQAVVAETEEAMVAFFIEGCRFDMQAGLTERAVASIQAALEYCCFAPGIPVGERHLVPNQLCLAVDPKETWPAFRPP